MKILLLGCRGQLGRSINDQLLNTCHELICLSRDQIDIINFEEIKNQILKISPDIVINAAAYTEVDKAEENIETANLINCFAVKNIADICRLLDCWLIHISTDYVFDGKSKIPYKEDDVTNPQTIYGKSKLNGELEIFSSGCKYIIIRTAWVFSEYGNNFLKTMLRLGSNNNELNIIGDQVGCPTYAQDLARSIVTIIPKIFDNKLSGLYHYCGDHSCSWYDFANVIFHHAKIKRLKTPKIINSIKTSAYPTPAKRPPFSVLDCSKIESDFGVYTSNWHEGIDKVVSKLYKNYKTM